MVHRKRKYECGAATAFVSRNKALKKLQLSLSDFRRLCILKGIYPQEPRHPKKAGKGSTLPKTYYYQKDIQFLLHEPLVDKLRQYKIFVKKLKKAIDKREAGAEKRIRKSKPKFCLDHIVKERYPTLVDAVRDLDDALSLCFLFSTMPKNKKVHTEQVQLCRRLTVEFLNYLIASKSLRKVFISIKGYYYQVEIMGQKVTWLAPHNVAYEHPVDVDYRILSTFAEFSGILLGFVNFALYKSLGLNYPPQVEVEKHIMEADKHSTKADLSEMILAALSENFQFDEPEATPDKFETDELNPIENQRKELEEVEKLQTLFKGLKFFLNREVNREVFTFIIRACGGEVSWCKTVYSVGATYDSDDETITHHLVDRPVLKNALFSRYYIQPQWVADCINARRLLPVTDYYPGNILPPHLSPFVEEEEGEYVPPEKRRLAGELLEEDEEEDEEEEDEDEENEEEEMEEEMEEDDDEEKNKKEKEQNLKDHKKVVTTGKIEKVDPVRTQQKEKNEEKRLAEMLIPKKKRRLYDKIQRKQKKTRQEAQKLQEKRKIIDDQQKQAKKKSKKQKMSTQ